MDEVDTRRAYGRLSPVPVLGGPDRLWPHPVGTLPMRVTHGVVAGRATLTVYVHDLAAGVSDLGFLIVT